MNAFELARSEVTHAVQRMVSLIEATPEDRAHWRPSESSRNILEVAAHTAEALANIEMQMRGTPFSIPTSAEADAEFRLRDRAITSRAQAIAALQTSLASYTRFLDSLIESDLDRLAPLPFGLGEGPLRDYIFAGYHHTLGHIAQIEYIQTMYGDHD